uniref:Glutathione transferase n=1 Tax=Paramoeba aestuarina TaxID=180227 RepID=A0A7S4JSJ9_9EUKA|mmetsp:Transcript_12781/g.19635  ORF Transcript_12781/g.19635 Transcript_12781/m.19635 type:complete len:280 (+) Transcript_12781:75-914(+)|eukprot:CAMPEP_0201524166 /NCGR_PEP_ID=MMETSP0161_2-20130828/21154_1 /ASSEMBLY_ACC=CAM_ASM_000251 /TAXON_ID=180227 /ORGANISM="Neoparamoeba aestuarina, Strain SoJaBio B1-5/56/2" /LENGTH=279 /DNA_ID=CAMNT_0047923457 /DNA_START=71 /DNA_END=910 /DNA_ORIENTATION=+
MADDKKKESSAFSSINRPTAGAREQKDLPAGEHPIQLYSLATPNGIKVTTLLIELGLAFDAYKINIMKGEQFWSGFVDINPNSKIPALVDKNGPNGQSVNVFESGNILLYLAEKTGRFIPSDPVKRVECLNWLFHQMGAGPYFGQFGHFYKYANEKIPYAIDRYTMETQRLLSVLDQALEGKEWLVGDELTIADFAWIPWVRCIETGYNAKEHVGLDNYKNVAAWCDRWLARPAVAEGLKINAWAPDAYANYHTDGTTSIKVTNEELAKKKEEEAAEQK